MRKLARTSHISSLRDVASLINSGVDLDAVLSDLVLAACRHANWTMGSIMSIDATTGFAQVICRYDPTLLQKELPDRWALATSPATVALSRNQPVYIRNARESAEFPGYRQEAFERDYHTVLVVPMSCRDSRHQPMVLTVISREIMDVSDEDLAFIGLIVHLGEIAVEKQQRLLDERRAAARLQSVLQVHTSLLGQALSEASIPALTSTIGMMLPNPMVVVDFSTGTLVTGHTPEERLFTDDAWRRAVDTVLREPLMKAARSAVEFSQDTPETLYLDNGTERYRVAPRIEPLTVDGEAVGALIIFPTRQDFNDLDLMLLDSARFALSVQMMRSFVRFRFESRTLDDLFREIVERRWRDAEDAMQRAQRLGLNLGVARQMIVVELPAGTGRQTTTSTDLRHAAMRIVEQSRISASVIDYEQSIICLAVFDDGGAAARLSKLAQRLSDELRRYIDAEPIVVVSEICRALGDYATAWEKCHRIIQIGRGFGRSGVLSSQDFGPLPMLAAAAEVDDVRAFVRDSIGAIAAHDSARGTPYLETLATYLREGCRNQACADTMGLHVTTLRYRLTRIEDLFGISLDTPEKRFAVELALRLHALIESQS